MDRDINERFHKRLTTAFWQGWFAGAYAGTLTGALLLACVVVGHLALHR